MNQLSKRSLARLAGVNPLLIAIVTDAVKESPYDFGIPKYGGMRAAKDQKELYDKGKSRCDGYNKKSYHQSGNAFDIFGYHNGKATWDKQVLTAIARHIQKVARDNYKVELTWGGDWTSFVDMPHFQI